MRALLIILLLSEQALARQPTKYDDKLKAIALKEDVPAELLSAVCYTESRHKPLAINPNDGNGNSIGLCQIKLRTAKWLGYQGTEQGLLNPITNATYAAKYISYQLQRYDGDEEKAVAAYNLGRALTCKTSRLYFVVKTKSTTEVTTKKRVTCTGGELLNQDYVDKVMDNMLASEDIQ